MRTYSSFWLAYCAGLICLSAAWAERERAPAPHPAEAMDMGAWLRLPERERNAVVEQYAGSRPRASRLNARERMAG